MKKNIFLLSLSLLSFLQGYSQNSFPSTGNVGIGIVHPGSPLTIAGNGTAVSITPGGYPYLGAISFNREVTTGTIFDSRGFGYQINNGGTDANMHFQVWSGQGDLVTNNALVISGNGYIGIGTASPKESLSVNGNIRSKQITVETANWPDYVFKPTYSLLSLGEVKAYFNKNQRLPEMPSAMEVAEKGINLGEMNKLLTKKVEELTLYLIEKDKIDQQQESQIKHQQSQIDILQEEVAKLLVDPGKK